MKTILTALICLLSFTSIAQDTEQVCMPTNVARQVAQDLVMGDSAKAMLTVTIDELDLTKEKLSFKDSLIFNARLKEINYQDQIRLKQKEVDSYVLLYEDSKKQYAVLAKKYRRYKVKQTFIKTLGIAIIGGLTYLHFK